jgi:hypothetical protein
LPPSKPSSAISSSSRIIGSLGSSRGSRWISGLNGSSLDIPGATLVARGRVPAQRPPDRLAVQPRPPLQLPDRDASHKVQPAQLGPLLRAQYEPNKASTAQAGAAPPSLAAAGPAAAPRPGGTRRAQPEAASQGPQAPR